MLARHRLHVPQLQYNGASRRCMDCNKCTTLREMLVMMGWRGSGVLEPEAYGKSVLLTQCCCKINTALKGKVHESDGLQQ